MDNKRNKSTINFDLLSPSEIENKAEKLGVSKTSMSPRQVFLLAMMAGAFIALGAMFFSLVVGDPGIPFAVQRVLGGILFSLGLFLVVVCGAELFTGNTLIVMAAASKKIKWRSLFLNWLIVFFGNLIGALVIVFLVYLSQMQSMNNGIVGSSIVSIAYSKMSGDWLTLFTKGIMCNFLVCLGIWVSYSARSVVDKLFGVMLPICAFVACGFEHCIANMFFMPMGLLLNATGTIVEGCDVVGLNIGGMLWNWSATVPGNIIGGAIFVGMMYWWSYHKKHQENL